MNYSNLQFINALYFNIRVVQGWGRVEGTIWRWHVYIETHKIREYVGPSNPTFLKT